MEEIANVFAAIMRRIRELRLDLGAPTDILVPQGEFCSWQR
jgi:hypothetical protein